MARHEREFRSGSREPLDLDELFALLGSEAGPEARQEAIACYLSGGDGWRDAMKQLGGAFADDATKLRTRKTG